MTLLDLFTIFVYSIMATIGVYLLASGLDTPQQSRMPTLAECDYDTDKFIAALDVWYEQRVTK